MYGISDFLRPCIHSPLAPKLYSVIAKENVLDDGFDPAVILPNKDYFTIRLCEMYLAKSKGYFQTFMPMAVLVSDFKYGTERHTIPFLVDSHILNLVPQIEGEIVEFKNTRIAGPIPYIGDDVSLFIGLFRLAVSNMGKSLFNLCEQLVKTFDPCGLSNYLALAKTLGHSLPDVLGMEDCQFRLGTRDVFTDTPGTANQFRQRYMAYINCPEHRFKPGELWVEKNRLLYGSSRDSIAPVREYDYCLLKIERSENRSDYTSFDFYSLWKEAHNLLMENAFQKARFKKIEFMQQINTSADLTEGNKEELIALFHLKFDHLYNRQQAALEAAGEKVETYRGGTFNAETQPIGRRDEDWVSDQVTNFLQTSAGVAKPAMVGRRLNRLKNSWRALSLESGPESELNKPGTSVTNAKQNGDSAVNREINLQLAELKKHRQAEEPDPSGLMEALLSAEFKR